MINKIKKHEEFLKKNIFFTYTKWPQFNLLINEIKKFSQSKRIKNVISLERNSLYGGVSLFAPFFSKKNFISVDCVSNKLLKRGAYNKIASDSKDFIFVRKNFQYNYTNIQIKNYKADLIIVPNLMNHIPEIEIFLSKAKKLLKKGGNIYFFEPLVRELHQIPEDYFRITPFGFKYLLKKKKFKNFKIKYEGGPFSIISYCWDQAIQYLPKKKQKKKKSWLKKNHSKLTKLDKKYKKNIVRNNTIFPSAFSVTATNE